MTDEGSLPARAGIGRMHATDDPYRDIVPGSWWRLTGSYKGLESRDTHEHGLIMLLSDVRIIDGEIHTLILREHPRFGEGGIKILLGDFIENFTHQEDGEALRSIELAELMDDINGITAKLASPPSDQEFLAQLPPPEANQPVGDARVPAALLPSGDVNAAQARIEAAIAVMEARKDWVASHTAQMQSRMALVGGYQKEKVDVALAGISEQRKAAEQLLSGVHTMRLFLGEDQQFMTLVEGEGAAADRPLHFMQRLLYLDEELFTHSRLDGLNGDDFGNLPEILSRNPDLVERMLPHDRCVAIARMRRNTRAIDFEINISNIFEVMNIVEADQRIQILIRNGEQIHLVSTDEITSKATRLFPSRSEIDGIFKHRDHRSGGYRTITPHDIEYSDKRSDHDARALFYKRVLLVLWGLSEREGVFGDFIAPGANWLEETVHNDRFVFVHDEEDVLPDGRYPSIRSFLSHNREGVQHGSRVLVQWRNAITEDTAPQMYEARTRSSDYVYLKNNPVEDFSLVLAQRKDCDVIAACPVTRNSWRSDRSRVFNSPVKLKTHNQSWGKFTTVTAGGFICLDALTADDLRYYFNSRIHREHYLEYLHLFDRALTILSDEEAKCSVVRETLGQDPDLAGSVIDQALHVWRTAAKGAIPTTDKEISRVRDISAFLSTDMPDPDPETIFVDATSGRTLEIARLEHVDLFGTRIPIAAVDIMTHGARTGWRRKSETLSAITPAAAPGAIRIQQGISPEVMRELEAVPPSLRDPSSLGCLMDGLSDDAVEQGVGKVMSFVRDERFFDTDGLLDEASAYFRANLRNREGTVTVPVIRQTIGFVMDMHRSTPDMYRLSLMVRPDYMALSNGRKDELVDFLDELYLHPDRRLGSMEYKLERGHTLPVYIGAHRIDATENIARDPSLKALNFEAEAEYSFILRVQREKDGFIEKDGLLSRDLRELMVRRIASRGHYRVPEDPAKLAEYMEAIRFHILPGCEGILEEVSELELPDQSAEESLSGSEVENGPSA